MIRSLVRAILLPGPPRGLGIDVVADGRVSERLAARHFTPAERSSFSRDLPFAAREAVVKAVGGVGVPGAPLLDMAIARVDGALVFVPGPRYVPVLARKAVARVHLEELSFSPPWPMCGVLAVACGQGEPHPAVFAVVVRRQASNDLSRLNDEEHRVVRGRHDPSPSIANRVAAREAARLLGIAGEVSVDGGGGTRPSLRGAADFLLSLGHEGDLGVAAVLR